jgi:hypothetical protein
MKKLLLLILLAGPALAGGFSLGLNYPWHQEGGQHLYGGMFGEMTPAQRTAIEAHFRTMQEDGITALRLWLLADGWRWPTFTAGRPDPLPERFVEDLRWFARAAHSHGIRIQPAIWDFYINRKHRHWVADEAIARDLATRVVAPLVAALAGEPGIASWDVMNEPDWITVRRDDRGPDPDPARDLPPDLGASHDLAVMRRFMSLHVDAIHAAGARATIGCAAAKWVHMWKGLGLDEYQVHFYPPASAAFLGDQQFRFLLPAVSRLKLDRPCILGEFPPNLRRTDLTDVLDIIRSKGYAGAWAWSYFGHGYPEDLAHSFSYRARRAQFRSYAAGLAGRR